MNKVLSGVFLAAAVTVFATAAFADDDPAMFQDGTFCVGTYWCNSTGVASNGAFGSTLEFVMKTSTGAGDRGVTSFALGWVAATSGANGTGKIQDLLDFTTVGGQDVVFLYCGDADCSSDDVGLPAATVPTLSASFQDGTLYTPTVGQAGFANSYNYQNSTNNTGPIVNVNPTQYGIIDRGTINGTGKTASVPEPSAVVLLGSMMIGLAAFARKKFTERA